MVFFPFLFGVFSGTVQERIDEVLREMSAGNEENEEDEEA